MTRLDPTDDRPPGTILVATDLGEAARATIEAALRLRPPGSPLHLLHVAPLPDPVHLLAGDLSVRDEGASAVGMDRASRLAEVRTHLEGLDLRPDRLRTHLRNGHPHQVIGEVASEIDARLVVLGSHRPRRHFDGLLGSTAERVVRTTRVPCLLVNREIVKVPTRILVATDLSFHARHALHMAVRWGAVWAAMEGGSPVTIDLLLVADFARPGYRPVDRDAELTQAVEEAMGRGGNAVTVAPRIVSHPLAADGILAVARESGADLVFMGTHGHGPLLRALIGSVASEVLRTLPLPLVIVPKPPSRKEVR